MSRLYVYVDGFNLYHALDDLGQNHLKWLDLWALANELRVPGENVHAVKYFSAYATWRTVSYRRHQRYVGALQARGVEFVEGRFKDKPMRCRVCGARYTAHEEKETDVNIGAHLLADALRHRFDRALVVTADTDLNEAVQLANTELSRRAVLLVAPPGRKGRNSSAAFEITKGRIRRSLLPERIVHQGRTIERPQEYDPPTSP